MREIEEAIEKVEAGDVTQGLKKLHQAVHHADDEDQYEIAQLYHQWGHVGRARNIVEELIERYPDENELVFFLVDLMIDSGEEEKAISLLEDVKNDEVDELRALLLSADIYASQGVDEVAEQKLLEAKRLAPEEPVITYALGEFYYMTGEYKKSIPLFEQVIRDGGIPDQNVDLRLAEALSASGEFETALPYFQKVSQDSMDLNGWFQYGVTAFQAGEFQQTIHALSVLREKDSHFEKLYTYLAKAYRMEGLTTEAKEAAEEGLRLNGFNDTLAYEIGDLARTEGRLEEAENYFKKALDIHAFHHDALKALAGLLLSQERFDEVIDLLSDIEDIEEQDPVFAWNLASALREEERFDEAMNHFTQAHERLSENPAFLEEYGDFLVEEGRRKEGIAIYKKAISYDKTLVHLEQRMAELEED